MTEDELTKIFSQNLSAEIYTSNGYDGETTIIINLIFKGELLSSSEDCIRGLTRD